MDLLKTKLEGVYILIPKVFGDHRGFFYGKLEPSDDGRSRSLF